MNLGALVSESRNPATLRLDEMTTLEMVSCFNQEDRKVPEAIEKVLPAIAQAVDLAAAALKAGGFDYEKDLAGAVHVAPDEAGGLALSFEAA